MSRLSIAQASWISTLVFQLTVLAWMLAAVLPADAQVNVCPDDTDGVAGDTIHVAILIDDPQEIDALGFQFLYDPEFLQYESMLASQLTSEWIAIDGNETVAGTVNVGGFHTTPIATSTPDTLGYLSLSVISATETTSYQLTNFQDDLAGTPDCWGDFNLAHPVSAVTWGQLKKHPRLAP